MDRNLRSSFAEMLGTFLLVYVGAGTVCAFYLPASSTWHPEVTGIALAEGSILAILLTCTTLISDGCCNPAITLMLYVFKRYDLGRTVTLIVVQLLGAVLAGLCLRLTFSDAVLMPARLGTPHLTEALMPLVDGKPTITMGSVFSAVLLEAFFTAVVTLAILASLVDKRGPRVGGVLVGMAQMLVVLFGFYLTGGKTNPARWFGPVIWQATLPTGIQLADNTVYWAGPIVGALGGAIVYSALFGLPERRTDASP